MHSSSVSRPTSTPPIHYTHPSQSEEVIHQTLLFVSTPLSPIASISSISPLSPSSSSPSSSHNNNKNQGVFEDRIQTREMQEEEEGGRRNSILLPSSSIPPPPSSSSISPSISIPPSIPIHPSSRSRTTSMSSQYNRVRHRSDTSLLYPTVPASLQDLTKDSSSSLVKIHVQKGWIKEFEGDSSGKPRKRSPSKSTPGEERVLLYDSEKPWIPISTSPSSLPLQDTPHAPSSKLCDIFIAVDIHDPSTPILLKRFPITPTPYQLHLNGLFGYDPLNEPRCLARLNRLVYHTQDAQGRRLCLAQFIPGYSIRELVDAGVVKQRQDLEKINVVLLKYLKQVHAKGCVHQDIRVQNIRIQVKEPDLGAAGVTLGSVSASPVVAPEQGKRANALSSSSWWKQHVLEPFTKWTWHRNTKHSRDMSTRTNTATTATATTMKTTATMTTVIPSRLSLSSSSSSSLSVSPPLGPTQTSTIPSFHQRLEGMTRKSHSMQRRRKKTHHDPTEPARMPFPGHSSSSPLVHAPNVLSSGYTILRVDLIEWKRGQLSETLTKQQLAQYQKRDREMAWESIWGQRHRLPGGREELVGKAFALSSSTELKRWQSAGDRYRYT